MNTYKSVLKGLTYCLVPWFMVLFVFTGTAISGSISMEYSLGFNGVFKLSSWTPLTVSLENKGPSFNGSLEVIVTRGSEYLRNVKSATYAVDVNLPPGSTKSFPLTILIDTFTHPLEIRLTQDSTTILSSTLNLRPHYSDHGLTVLLDEKITPAFLSNLPAELKTVIPRAEFLPHTWFGYDGVEMIIANTGIIDSLRERQLNALAAWVDQGGFLILSSGHNYGSLLTPKIQRFLSVDVQGFKKVFQLDSLAGFSGRQLKSKNPFLILQTEIAGAIPLLKERGIPIILQSKIGQGKIIFIAFDFQAQPFIEWEGHRALWNKIWEQKPQPGFFASKHQDQEILPLMISQIVPGFPGFLWTFGFLAVYLALGQFFFTRLIKKNDQRRRFLAYLAVMVVVVSVSCFWIYYRDSLKKTLTYNSYTRLKVVGNSRKAVMKYTIGFYSFRDEGIKLDFNPDTHPFRAIPSGKPEDMARHSYTLHQTEYGQTAVIPIDRWSNRFFQVDSVIDIQLQGEAVMEESVLKLSFKNNTPHDIINAWLFYTGRSLFIGTIPKGEVRMMSFDREMLSRQPSLTNREEIFQKTADLAQTPLLRTLQNSMMASLFFPIQSHFEQRKDVVYIVGWIDSEVGPSGLSPQDAEGESAAILEWEIPVRDKS